MKIDIWSDYACPFCYIGKRRLEHALSQFPHRDQVEVNFRSFQLDPKAKVHGNSDIHDVLAAKYGMTREKAKAMNNQLAEQAKDVGLDFQFDSIVHTNTLDSHRLSYYANTQGKGAEMSERLLRAYFTDPLQLNLGERDVLAKLAADIGLNEQNTLDMLETEAYLDEVNKDIEEGQRLGITGVPFFVFNNKYAISGAQPGPVFIEVLDTVWAEEQGTPALQVVGKGQSEGQSEDGCDDGSCSV